MVSELGDNIPGITNTKYSIFLTIKKIFSKERILYLTIGIVLLVCIYYYLQLKKAKKEENEQDIYLKQKNQTIDDLESFEDAKIVDNSSKNDNLHSFQTPDGFVTIPIDTYNELQEGYQKAAVNDDYDVSSDNYKMENNLSVSDQDEEENAIQSNEEIDIQPKQSSEEDSRVKEQDLTNTEIQSIQHQLNSFK